MNLRTFFKTVGVVSATPWSSVVSFINMPRRVHPKGPDELPGMWAIDRLWNQTFYIVCELDGCGELYKGQTLRNYRRNLFFVDRGEGVELACITLEPDDSKPYPAPWKYPDTIEFYTSDPKSYVQTP